MTTETPPDWDAAKDQTFYEPMAPGAAPASPRESARRERKRVQEQLFARALELRRIAQALCRTTTPHDDEDGDGRKRYGSLQEAAVRILEGVDFVKRAIGEIEMERIESDLLAIADDLPL